MDITFQYVKDEFTFKTVNLTFRVSSEMHCRGVSRDELWEFRISNEDGSLFGSSNLKIQVSIPS